MLSRKLLKGMGLTDEQVESIIDVHLETVNEIKVERDKYKAEADKLPDVQKQLDEIKAQDGGKNKYKAMYESEHEELENLKADIASKELTAKKRGEMRDILLEIGMPEKRIAKILDVTNMDDLKLDENGKVEERSTLKKQLKDEWGEFIPTVSDVKHTPETPLNNISGAKMTRDQVMQIKDRNERHKAMWENRDQFPELSGHV